MKIQSNTLTKNNFTGHLYFADKNKNIKKINSVDFNTCEQNPLGHEIIDKLGIDYMDETNNLINFFAPYDVYISGNSEKMDKIMISAGKNPKEALEDKKVAREITLEGDNKRSGSLLNIKTITDEVIKEYEKGLENYDIFSSQENKKADGYGITKYDYVKQDYYPVKLYELSDDEVDRIRANQQKILRAAGGAKVEINGALEHTDNDVLICYDVKLTKSVPSKKEPLVSEKRYYFGDYMHRKKYLPRFLVSVISKQREQMTK